MIDPRFGRTLYTKEMSRKAFSIFSKRQKELRGETPDVYTYDVMPKPLKVQIIHIWNDIFGRYPFYMPEQKISLRILLLKPCVANTEFLN